MTKQRRARGLATIALAGLVLAACAVGNAEPTPPPDESDMPRPPSGAIEIGGEVYPLGLGSYCWSGPADETDQQDRLAVCVDAIGIITALPYAQATPGAALIIVGDSAAVDVEIRRAHLWTVPHEPIASADVPEPWEAWQPQGEPIALGVTGGTLVLPNDLEAGEYLLAIDVTRSGYPGDDASYGAVVGVR